MRGGSAGNTPEGFQAPGLHCSFDLFSRGVWVVVGGPAHVWLPGSLLRSTLRVSNQAIGVIIITHTAAVCSTVRHKCHPRFTRLTEICENLCKMIPVPKCLFRAGGELDELHSFICGENLAGCQELESGDREADEL